MGVPKFFRWISERYPCLSELVKEYQIPEFDNLYLDMNGIIHMCSHPNDFDPHFRITDEKIFKDIFHYIEVLFRMIQPRKLFFLAVDGVAPRAKMNQQRGRRFRSAKEAEILEQRAREKGEALPTEARFDSNCITPGTVFMARLQEQLKYFVSYKMSTDRQWREVKIILSGHETPGEGEHKIMDYIRYMKSQPGYDANTRHCLYGLDADLIMLGLCSHEPHFSLLREEVKYGRKAKQTRTSTPEETKFFLLHLSLMREYLELEFSELKTLLPFPFDVEKIIDDWVLMGFLVGNDFIPPLPDMHIINGALPTLYKAYIEVLPTLGGYINEGGTLNLERFKKYMDKLSAFDVAQFSEKYADLKYFQAKTGRRLGSKERHSYRNSGEKDSDDQEDMKPVKNPELAALIQMTEQELRVESDEEDEDDGEDCLSFDSDGDDNEALFFLEFRQHKKDYYMNKLEYATVNSEVLRSQADGYVRAIQWNLHYYYDGVCSWSWFYPHHYAPYISDICNFSENLELNFDMGKPFLPFQQLLAVLPAGSKTLLPIPYQQLMVEKESPIFHYYPSEFKTDLNGKKQEWEAVVLIPFIDEVSLLDAMAPCDARLTQDEKRRNSHGPMTIYTFSEEDLGVYDAPEYFPKIDNNHAKAVKVTREEIHVDRSCLVKGLCPGVRLSVYYPGFPTLMHIPHTSKLEKCKVKVFEQPSQGSNMILQIVDQGKPNIKEVASELLGRSIYVAWPHLQEAKVVAVSNKEFRYTIQDEGTSGGQPRITIDEVKGNSAGQWTLQRKGIEEHYKNRLGVEIGDTNILVHATPMTGRKYVFGVMGKITLEKQWCKTPVAYALQTTVRDIAVHDKTFQQYKTLQEVFPPKSVIFMVGYPHYGAMGEVMEGGKGGRVKVSVSVTPEPNLDALRKEHHDNLVRYMSGNVAGQRLGISTHLVSRITGTIFISVGDLNSDISNRVNVGLNLKFNKRNEEIPGYTRKDGTVWQYSNKAVDLVGNYYKEFPDLFEYLNSHTGNDVFCDVDVFPNNPGRVAEISNWLKEQPYTKLERQMCGSEVVEAELVQTLEKLLDEFQELDHRVKNVTMQVKPHLLYKPELQIGNIAPDPFAQHNLFDRIVNVRDSYTVSLGLKGTIIGVQHADKEEDIMYDIVFDKAFTGGLALNCSNNRGYRLPKPAMLNMSYGQRLEQVKTVNKPTAVVQPSGNSVVQDNFGVSPWNQGRTIGGGGGPHGNSAFASWNNNQQPIQIVPSNLASSPFYRAIQQPQRVGNTAPPQPAFTQASPRQQNPAVPRKQQRQNYPSPVGKVAGSGAVSSEFQELWFQLQKSPQKLQPPIQPPAPASAPRPEQVGGDSGTELLKKMLRISDDTPQPARPQMQQNMKQVSVEEIFEHARISTPAGATENVTTNCCVQLLSYFQQKGLGIPRYTYCNNIEDGKVRARVVLPDGKYFDGEPAATKNLSSESAARIALAHLPRDQTNNGMAKPGTNTLPIPPQQWYQQQPYHPQNYHHPRQDPNPDWRRGPGSEMIAAGGPPAGRAFKPPQLPQPFMFPHYQQQQQQQQHWRGSGPASSSSNWRQVYQQQQPPVPRQQEWQGESRRQENIQKQFVPLQAVKQQQRNKSRPQQTPQNQPQQPEQSTEKDKEICETRATTGKSNTTQETGRPNSVASKPVVSRPRKSRLAANFNVNMDSQ